MRKRCYLNKTKIVMEMVLLVLLLATFMAEQTPASPASFDTIDKLASAYSIEKCVECHGNVHKQWSLSGHAKSVVDSRVLRSWNTLILNGIDKSPKAKRSDLRQLCLSCHAPQANYATDGTITIIADLTVAAVTDKEKARMEEAKVKLAGLNVNCLICHNIKGSPDGQPEEKTIYGPTGSGETRHREAIGYKTVKSDIMSKPEFCAQCHHGCPPGMPSTICPTIYSSYREQYLAAGGTKRCHDCHMEKEEGKAGHRFPGIYDLDFVRTGLKLELKVLPTMYVYHLKNKLVPATVVHVKVTNSAGHIIPHG